VKRGIRREEGEEWVIRSKDFLEKKAGDYLH
jgi:hypothetical protein